MATGLSKASSEVIEEQSNTRNDLSFYISSVWLRLKLDTLTRCVWSPHICWCVPLLLVHLTSLDSTPILQSFNISNCLQAVLGGNASPSAADIEKICQAGMLPTASTMRVAAYTEIMRTEFEYRWRQC